MYCTMQIAPCSSTSSGNPEKKQWEGGGIVEEVVTAPCNGCRPGVDCLESVQHVQYFVPDRLTGNYFQKQMTGRSRSRQINRDMKMILPSKTCHLCVLTCVCLPNSCSHYQYQYPVSAPLDKLLLQSAHVSYWLHFWHLGLHLWVDHWHHVRPLPLRDGGAGGQNCWQHGTHASQVSFTIAIIQLRFVWISQYNVVLRNHLFYTITSSKGLYETQDLFDFRQTVKNAGRGFAPDTQDDDIVDEVENTHIISCSQWCIHPIQSNHGDSF